MQPDRLDRLEFDDEIDPRKQELVLQPVEIGQLRQKSGHVLPRHAVVRLEVGHGQADAFPQQRTGQAEDQDRHPHVLREREPADTRAIHRKLVGDEIRRPQFPLADPVAERRHSGPLAGTRRPRRTSAPSDPAAGGGCAR